MLDLSVSAVLRRIRTGAITGVKLHHRPDCADGCRCPWRVRVSAISRYTRRIRADRRAFYAYYAWAVYVGDERRTGPGLD